MYIEKINSPADVKLLQLPQLEELSKEIRFHLLNKLSKHGGHIGPNLGMVEATIALHYVFNIGVLGLAGRYERCYASSGTYMQRGIYCHDKLEY